MTTYMEGRPIPDHWKHVELDDYFSWDEAERRDFERTIWLMTEGELEMTNPDTAVVEVWLSAFYVTVMAYSMPIRVEDGSLVTEIRQYPRHDLPEG